MKEFHVCEVCKRLDHDKTLKECIYCKLCKAWICMDDVVRLGRRARAMLTPRTNVISESSLYGPTHRQRGFH